MPVHRAFPYSVKLGAIPRSLENVGSLPEKQEFENLGPLGAARLPAMELRSEQSSERCGTDPGRVGNSETLTCFGANGELGSQKALESWLTRELRTWNHSNSLVSTFSKQNYYCRLTLLLCFFLLSLLPSQEI